MLDLNLIHLSRTSLLFSNLLGMTSLAPKFKWKSIHHKTYAEKNGEALSADIYLPEASGKRPAVIVVHGGGWSNRTRRDTVFYSQQLASQGFVVINCSYRLAPKYIYPASVEDIRDVYHWTVQNAAEWNVDPERIGGMGYSAGAHLLSLVAAWASQKRPGYEDVKFKSLVCGSGVYDFMVYPQSPYIHRYTTFYRDQNLDVYKNASPLHQLGSGRLPHFFLFHSKNDELVEHEQMLRFAEKIKEAGGTVDTFTVAKLKHAHTFVLSIKSLELAVEALKKSL